MKKWQILIIGAGPKLVSVATANEIVADLLEDGQNVKQAVLTVEGGAPEESANLLHERDTKVAEGRDTKIKPRKKPRADPKHVKDLEAKLAHADGELQEAAGLLEKLSASNEALEKELSSTQNDRDALRDQVNELEKKIAAAEAASPLAAVAVSEVK